MNRFMKEFSESKVIVVCRGIAEEEIVNVASALYDGGIRMMEITYDQRDPDSWETTAASIGEIAKAFEGRMLVGAGTVTSTHLVELTHKAGGLFIISPNVNTDVIRRTRELGMVSMPGALTPTDVVTAWEAGADIVKLFPISTFGPGYLKAIKAPLSHIPMMAVGGINEKNIADYLAAGAIGVGVGGNLANKTWIDAGEYHKITEVAKAMVAAL